MKKNQTTWSFKDMYTGIADPALERDMKRVERACSKFARTYSDNKFLASDRALAAAIADYEKLELLPDPYYYLMLEQALDSQNTKLQALGTLCMQRMTNAQNNLIFFRNAIGRLDESKKRRFLESKELAHYRYWLTDLFQASRYQLSDDVEMMARIKSQTAYSLWIDAGQKQQGSATVKHKGQDMPISEAAFLVSDLPRASRHSLHSKLTAEYKRLAEFSEAEINAVVLDRKAEDEFRGAKDPYERTLVGYENTPKELSALRDTVAKNRKISQDFLKLKKEILGYDTLEYCDRGVKIGEVNRAFDLVGSRQLVEDAFDAVDTEFGDVVRMMFADGRVDVYPRAGKSGGAFCAGGGAIPTHVLLNHVDTFTSMQTMAHEFGHGVHAEFSRRQTPIYQGHTISVAEVASTFFESVTLDYVWNDLTDKEKIVVLHDKIGRSVATIWRQIACFNFETELHNRIRKEGYMTKEAMAELMNVHMKWYLGSAIELAPDDGYFFVVWSHIRRYFYTYAYAYGELISQALFANYKKDPTYLSTVKNFLSAGESQSPRDIFKAAGIDTENPEFYQTGINAIKKDLNLLKKLTKK